MLFFKYIVITDEPIAEVVFRNRQLEFGDRDFHWARSSVGLERTPDKREVGSSNLPGPIAFG